MPRKPKARIVTADDMERIEAAVAPPGYGQDPGAKAAGWDRPDAVVRYCGLAHEALHRITVGLNDLMQYVDGVDREAQMRRSPMGGGFDFAMVRDLVRSAGHIIGEYLPDRYWADSVAADEERADRADARRAGAAGTTAALARGIPIVGDIDSGDLARLFRGEVVDVPVLHKLERVMKTEAGGGKRTKAGAARLVKS
jgi:hypothetical protein